MSNIQYNTSTASTATEEPKYPEREFALDRMSAKERNSGSICFKFAHEFRQSNFYFTFSLSQQRDQILLPPRSSLIQHIQEVSPNYQFPSCLSNKDLTVERKIKKSSADDENAEIIKFEYKKTTITADEEAEEDLEEHEDQEGSKKDSDSENQEEYSEEDLIGDFDINRYNDNETGEDNDDDDGDDDDD